MFNGVTPAPDEKTVTGGDLTQLTTSSANKRFRTLLAAALLLSVSSPVSSLELAEYRIIDLTHPYTAETIYWPTSPTKFQLTELAYGETPGGWFYSSYSLCTPEHGGTHFDAPIHFSASGAPVHDVPLEDVIAPAVTIDVSARAGGDSNYRLAVDDVLEFEAQHGEIEAGMIVLLRTGWSERWPDTAAYMGDDTPGEVGGLSFPGYGVAAARLLVEQRGVSVLGIDTASIDHGPSKDFAVHVLAAARNVGALENLTGLDQLPPRGFTVFALPIKIEGGSGAPMRAVALVPRESP